MRAVLVVHERIPFHENVLGPMNVLSIHAKCTIQCPFVAFCLPLMGLDTAGKTRNKTEKASMIELLRALA